MWRNDEATRAQLGAIDSYEKHYGFKVIDKLTKGVCYDIIDAFVKGNKSLSIENGMIVGTNCTVNSTPSTINLKKPKLKSSNYYPTFSNNKNIDEGGVALQDIEEASEDGYLEHY